MLPAASMHARYQRSHLLLTDQEPYLDNQPQVSCSQACQGCSTCMMSCCGSVCARAAACTVHNWCCHNDSYQHSMALACVA